MTVIRTYTHNLGATLSEMDAFIAQIRAETPPGASTRVKSHYCEPCDYLTVDVTYPKEAKL